MLDSTPILPVVDIATSIAFYRAAGFDTRGWGDGGGYTFVEYDGESVFDLDRPEFEFDPATNGAGCYLVVPHVDAWHEYMIAAGLPVNQVEDKDWGMREFTLTDQSGNQLRIGRPI